MRCICAVFILIGCALPAQAAPLDDQRGWSFSGRFGGTANSSNTVLKADPSVGYAFNRNIQTYVGLPFYVANQSTTNTTMNGIGNAYAGIRATVDNPAVRYTSNLVFSAPTGDKDRGFSTGRMTVDWTNTFSRRFSSVTPFGSVGLANTVSDTSFFVRPFSSLGTVSHFEGGAEVAVGPLVTVGGSAYAIRAAGEQRIISRVVKHGSSSSAGGSSSAGRGQNRGRGAQQRRGFETTTETVGSADLANDHGFSSWFSVSPRPEIYFEIGFNRSVAYDFNSVFFGVGFRVGK